MPNIETFIRTLTLYKEIHTIDSNYFSSLKTINFKRRSLEKTLFLKRERKLKTIASFLFSNISNLYINYRNLI